MNAHQFADDLSFKAVASQSKILYDPSNFYAASNAVDRNTATCMRTVAIGNTAVEKTTWWKADLSETFNIYSINILFKNYDNLGMYSIKSKQFDTCCYTQVEK